MRRYYWQIRSQADLERTLDLERGTGRDISGVVRGENRHGLTRVWISSTAGLGTTVHLDDENRFTWKDVRVQPGERFSIVGADGDNKTLRFDRRPIALDLDRPSELTFEQLDALEEKDPLKIELEKERQRIIEHVERETKKALQGPK